MSDKAASQKTRSPEGCDENGPAAALLLSHVSIQICSFVAPCRRPILIATPLNQSRTWCTRAFSFSRTILEKLNFNLIECCLRSPPDFKMKSTTKLHAHRNAAAIAWPGIPAPYASDQLML